MRRQKRSELLDSILETAKGLKKAKVIDKKVLDQFKELCNQSKKALK